MAGISDRVRPLGDRVVVQRVAEDTRSPGGIYIPEVAKEKPIDGIVVAVGRGAWRDGQIVPLDVQIGDRVIVGKYAGSEVKVDGIAFLVLREDDLLAVIAPAKEA